MFYVITYTILALGLAFLIGSGRFIWKLRTEDAHINFVSKWAPPDDEVRITVHVPYEDDEDDEDNDDYDEDNDDYDEDEFDYPAGPVYGPETFEIANMTLRLSKPHLFSDDWYENSKREFSAWAVGEWVKINNHRREYGLAS